MAEFPQQALNDIQRGIQYLSNLNQEYLSDLQRGCVTCKPDSFDELKNTIRALEYKVALDQYDAVAAANLNIMLKIIGGYTLKVPPTVNAGSDQTVTIDTASVTFNAVITQGSGTITSISWEQISGTQATLTNADTANLTVTGIALGTIGLQLTVTDSNGFVVSDEVTLTTVGTITMIRWGAFDTEPDLTTVTLPNNMVVPTGSTEITIPFGETAANKFIAWSQPTAEPDKTQWFNTAFNYGEVPDGVFKAKVVASGNDIYGTRDLFSFDSTNYTLKVSI